MDGDTNSIQDIQRAIDILRQDGWIAWTRIYAEPARSENRKWKALFQQPGVLFCPIARGKSAQGEENDVAISAEFRKLPQSLQLRHIALMTRDLDFSKAVQQAADMDLEVLVVLPENSVSAIRGFDQAGARTLTFPPLRDSSPRVRAMLQPDGCGTVCFAEPFYYSTEDPHEKLEEIKSFLQGFSYGEDDSFLVQSIAKFWFNNARESLTVYPMPIAVKALLKLANACRRSAFTSYADNLFFCLPTGSAAKTQLSKYGNCHAKAVFLGGGPFILRDSRKLVRRVLSRLGYLDPTWNPDLAEAMLTFVNVTHNKKTLRKFGALPSPHDNVADVSAKLRHSFLSDTCGFEWKLAPEGAETRKILCKQGLLDSETAPKAQVFDAMQEYAQKKGLPERKNYNTYASEVLASSTRPQPTKIGHVEFRR